MEQGTLTDDKKRAHAIPDEANQYEILNGTLYHFFQPRAKVKNPKAEIIKQVGVPQVLEN